MQSELEKIILSIDEPCKTAMEEAEKYQQSLAKPPKSLGKLEDISVKLAGITGKVHNKIEKKHLFVFAADNGVTAEGVSSAPQSVTLKQTINLTKEKTGAAVLAANFGSDITVCDVGINEDLPKSDVLDMKIAYGTNNIAKGPAMTKEQAVKAIVTGAEVIKNTDADIFGIGEMGIGNTTTASAVLAVLTNSNIEDVTGRGGGITDDSFKKKKEVIKKAIEINKPDKNDVVDVISKVGGFDIAAMCGAYLGAASSKKPVVVDGFISAVAALCAARLCPLVKHYLIASHASFEIGYNIAIEKLGISPLLNLDMRLGEGSGCPLAFQIVDAACAVMNKMATFEDADINDDYLTEIREGDKFTP